MLVHGKSSDGLHEGRHSRISKIYIEPTSKGVSRKAVCRRASAEHELKMGQGKKRWQGEKVRRRRLGGGPRKIWGVREEGNENRP